VVQLQPAASASGRLFDDKGRPRRNAHIGVAFRLQQWPNWQFPHNSVNTDAEGRFHIGGLAPGIEYYADGVFGPEAFASGQTKDLGDVRPSKKD
jgi:hypothetical protein